jgi:AcrR family transcriptional regulator
LNKSQTAKSAKRDELLAVGRRLFADHPYDELSIDELADRAGVAKGLLYYYFGSKRGYYTAVIEQAAAELRATTTTDPARPPAERLLAGLAAYLDFAEQHPEGYRALMGGGIGSDPAVREIVSRERATFVELITAGLTGSDAPAAALRATLEGWLSCIEGVCLDWLAHRDLSRDTVLQLLSKTLAGALAAARAVDPSSVADPAGLGL